ncbi:UDP-N-acetylglucosamine: 1L-myo-inositol-1-phosphate 1-alpha-D-N-acetylglucosaminyltransferase [Saccharomonospora azurea SZMC 14600]|uniref:D-inositol-3-phosphate glycosyltransferase n=1 Tax=Saccharomonospora azurea TaxID=40988 RepID=UPI0002400DB1|nr:D-inositol-3-phosphate glycosyltransferase [Saccharomonospora azurea]EHK86859.1 UDP-N-acetylglucosamine: 1L-myo-inositol-1-phosphate 1-alpha-D-N-acetylglucosaminyltransferase [Saccharomonospora azurea SZMC 14600]
MTISRHRAASRPRRIAVLSVHTSPLEQPGTKDAGGMNVYISQTAVEMARRGTSVEVFTRATSSDQPPVVELAPGVLVRHVPAGPFEPLTRGELPSQLCAFTSGVLRTEAFQEPGYYDLIHSHYWLSGQVGWLARERWGVPLVHTAHTLAKVKNAALAHGDTPEPRTRVIGEEQVVAEADRLVVNTEVEAEQLVRLYGADPDAVRTVSPGVDLDRFRPGGVEAARAALGLSPEAVVLAFAGRIQPLKAPDVLLKAAATLVRRDPELRRRLVVLVAGGASGTGLDQPASLRRLAGELGIADLVRFLPPQGGQDLVNVYRAADVVAVPSHNESFGLVALEAQACGTPVVAARVGGLPVAVADGESGLLVPSHAPDDWADALARVALRPAVRAALARGASRHAARFSWQRTTEALLDTYAEATRAFHGTALEVAV